MQRVKTYTTAKGYTQSGVVESKGANALMFINEGDVVVKLLGLITIRPGDNTVISQVDPNAADTTAYYIQFDPDHPDTTGDNQLLAVLSIGIQQ